MFEKFHTEAMWFEHKAYCGKVVVPNCVIEAGFSAQTFR